MMLYLVGGVNVEDMFKQGLVGGILGAMYGLAGFCDRWKQKHRLEEIINRVQGVGEGVEF